MYAIVRASTGEFYPDPVYNSLEKAGKKIAYLQEYERKHGMPVIDWQIEKLTPERKAQHDKEWSRFVSAID